MKKLGLVCFLALSAGSKVFAQSSVTLYGVIDEGVGFTNNAGGHQAWQMQSGYVYGSRWGLKGSEDLGAGLKALFTLENGFDVNSGAAAQSGRMFGRQAYVGVASDQLGTVTLGRQYDSVVDYLAPLTANGGYAGWPFSHPFDNDNTDNSFRLNNAAKYTSNNYGGLRFGGAYAFSNQAGGFSNNRAYSAGVSFSGGSLSAAAAYLQANNPGASSAGGLATDDTNFVASRQRVWGAGLSYTLGQAKAGFVYSHTTLDSPSASVYLGRLPVGLTSGKFDNFEVNATYQFSPSLSALAMYTYTKGTFDANAQQVKRNWHQGGLMVDYFVSKRTDVYAQAVYQQTTGGSTGTVLDDAYIAGAAGFSSSNKQILARVGIKHAF
ncbi:porin [Caballeronia sp. GAFFF1]|uniref:porin n=1 Tax=Caballeronia sp. GAFFF1 TaxID=2921779 RepID=UPI0020286DC0|nr:porin [Caballeronia sp. GAFFF1]